MLLESDGDETGHFKKRSGRVPGVPSESDNCVSDARRTGMWELISLPAAGDRRRQVLEF